MSNGIGRVWAVNAEGGDEGRPNGVGPVYIENADQLGSKLPEPAAGDVGKVLGVLNSSGDIGWVEDQSGTLTQVQADWAEDDSSQVSYIQNKPTIPAAQVNADWEAASGVAQILNKPTLATVATSGDYDDLLNKPTIPAAQVQSNWNEADTSSKAFIQNKPALAAVATSGNYSDLSGTPTIPTVSDNVAKFKYGVATYAQVVAAFNAGKAIYLYDGDSDDGIVATDISFGDDGGEIIFTKHNTYGAAGSSVQYKLTSANAWSTTTKSVPVQVQADWNQTNTAAADYIKNKPTIPAGVVVDQTYNASSTNAQSGTAVAGALATVNQVPASTSADEDKVLTVNSSGNAVWATAQSGSSYTAGDGIDISAQDEISVKAGNGITIGDYTYEHTGTLNLTATPVLNQGSYFASYIAQLTPELLAQMVYPNSLQVTLNGAYDGMGTNLFVGLATNATTYQTNLSNRVVFGNSLGTSIAAGTTVTFSFANVNSESTKSYADVAANVSSYYLVVFWIGYGLVGNAGQAAPSADPITTGTYNGTETVTVQNAVNLSTPIEVVASMPASPTSGVLYIVTGA